MTPYFFRTDNPIRSIAGSAEREDCIGHNRSNLSVEEMAVAKTRTRVVLRKKRSKRGKGKAKPGRKMVARHAAPKKRHAGLRAMKRAGKKKRPLKIDLETPKQVTTAAANAAEALVRAEETTVVDVIEEPAPGVVVVTEYESSVRTPPFPSRGGTSRRDKSSGPGAEE